MNKCGQVVWIKESQATVPTNEHIEYINLFISHLNIVPSNTLDKYKLIMNSK